MRTAQRPRFTSNPNAHPALRKRTAPPTAPPTPPSDPGAFIAALAKIKVLLPQLRALDDQIAADIKKMEELLRERGCRRLLAVPYDGIKLGWSQARPSRAHPEGRWRFVLIEEDGSTELLSSSSEERCDVLNGALQKLVHALIEEA